MKYEVTDGNGDDKIEAESAREACQKFVDGGDWGNDPKTSWVTCRATPLNADGERMEDDSESYTIEIPPTEHKCCGGEHVWATPLSVLGGLKENPGVQGHGGGVICTEVCKYCGCYKITDTWAQNPENGEQGLTSVEYRESDEESEAWLNRRVELAEQFVRDQVDSDKIDNDDLERHFANYFHRPPDDDDRAAGLWSLLCQAVEVERTED